MIRDKLEEVVSGLIFRSVDMKKIYQYELSITTSNDSRWLWKVVSHWYLRTVREIFIGHYVNTAEPIVHLPANPK